MMGEFIHDQHGPCAPGDDMQVIKLLPGKSEADAAKEYLARLSEAFKPLLAIFDEAAREHGFAIGFDSIAPGPPYMRHVVHNLRIVKAYYG
jgi:hypothetical protein